MAATVTYSYPVSGSTAPTSAQMNGNAPHNIVTGTINFADADTTAAITHNFGNYATGQGEGATESSKEFPIPNLWPITLGTATGTVVPQFSFQYTSATVMTITKGGTGNGVGGTYGFALMRPGSLQR